MPTISHALAENIKRLRKLKGLSQVDLAGLVGTSRQTIVNYEGGDAGIDSKTIARLAGALGVEETELVKPLPAADALRKIELRLKALESSTDDEIARMRIGLSEDKRTLMDLVLSMNEEQAARYAVALTNTLQSEAPTTKDKKNSR